MLRVAEDAAERVFEGGERFGRVAGEDLDFGELVFESDVLLCVDEVVGVLREERVPAASRRARSVWSLCCRWAGGRPV